jgi:hypothetical protein
MVRATTSLPVPVSPASDHEAEMENTGDFASYPTPAEESGGLQQISEVRRQVRKRRLSRPFAEASSG